MLVFSSLLAIEPDCGTFAYMNLNGKNALVTGGSIRIGRGICEGLAANGCNVVVHYRSSEGPANELCSRLEQDGVKAWAVQADFNVPGDAEKMFAEAVEMAGDMDILVNNAGVFTKEAVGKMTEESIRDQFWPNLVAPMLLTKAFAARGRPGRIVNLVDRRVTSLDTSCVPYVLSKKALMDFTGISARALAPDITVNAVAPGPVLPPPGEDDEYLKTKAGPIPLGEPCSPLQVADAVLFLLQADSVTGQVIYVDGGQHLLNGVEI